jgi:Flp pilus assembly protein TadG
VVEFAFVIPILLMVFIAIADFGRIFAASIAIEAATRNAAEATANRYLSDKPGGTLVPLDQPAPPGDPAYYGPLHTYAASVVCAELRDQPNTNYDSLTSTCPDMPVVMVCVHDSQDTNCAATSSPGSAPVPAECTVFTPTPTSDQLGTRARWVEVRTCYHFTALLSIPLFSLGDFWLQRTNEFTIPCYFALGAAECG